MKQLQQMKLKVRSKKRMKTQQHFDPKKAAIAAAIARAKAKKAAAEAAKETE